MVIYPEVPSTVSECASSEMPQARVNSVPTGNIHGRNKKTWHQHEFLGPSTIALLSSVALYVSAETEAKETEMSLLPSLRASRAVPSAGWQ